MTTVRIAGAISLFAIAIYHAGSLLVVGCRVKLGALDDDFGVWRNGEPAVAFGVRWVPCHGAMYHGVGDIGW